MNQSLNSSSSDLQGNRSDLIVAIDRSVSAVSTRKLDFSFNELADMYTDRELIISPEYQRLFRWTPGAQSRFIETLILELPVPPIFLIENEDREYELIDGLQRFSSYLHFIGALRLADDDAALDNPLVLIDCDIVRDLNGLTYARLPRALQIKLKRSYVRAEILTKESDRRLRYHMFKRLNTGGERLSPQEIRNATIRLLDNTFNEKVIELSEYYNFKDLVNLSPGTIQKRGLQEYVLRFFAFRNYMDHYDHVLDDFLTDYLEAVSDPSTPGGAQFPYETEEAIFRTVFDTCAAIEKELGWEKQIFGAVQRDRSATLPFNKKATTQFSGFHFDAITTALALHASKIDVNDPAMVAALAAATLAVKTGTEFGELVGGGKNYRSLALRRLELFNSAYSEVFDVSS